MIVVSSVHLEKPEAISIIVRYLVRSKNPVFTKFLVGLLLSFPDDYINQDENLVMLFSPSGLNGRNVKENLRICQLALEVMFLGSGR
jgi:hypothetical protein